MQAESFEINMVVSKKSRGAKRCALRYYLAKRDPRGGCPHPKSLSPTVGSGRRAERLLSPSPLLGWTPCGEEKSQILFGVNYF